MTIYHQEQGADPGAIVYAGIKGTYELLLKADATTSISALYKDDGGQETQPTLTLTSIWDFPPDILGLANYIQVSNTYTLSPAFGKDPKGNNNLQHPTWVFLRVKTTYLCLHLVGLIQPSLNLLNVSLKEKEMPYLDTKTRFAFVETTNDWCPAALLEVLKKALEKHISSMKKDGLLRGEYSN